MALARSRRLIVIFLIHAAVVSGIVSLHLFFSLPIATLQGVDLIALPGESVNLSCMVEVDPPGIGAHRREGLKVIFKQGEKTVGEAVTDSSGCARTAFTAGKKEEIHRQIRIGLALDLGRGFAYRHSDPSLLLEVVSGGSMLYLCDIDATLSEGRWDRIDPRYPEEWKADEEAPSVLAGLNRGSVSRVIYVAPWKRRYTEEVRAYLRRNRFPMGPILFPEAPPSPRTLTAFLELLLKKWPHVEFGVTRRNEFVSALSARGIRSVVVKASPGSISPAPKVSYARTWKDVK